MSDNYEYYTYKKSSVIGGSWSTPFGTPFFIRWGDWSIKVPMDRLRYEYEAWENMKLQRRRMSSLVLRSAKCTDVFRSHPAAEPEPPKPEPLPSILSDRFDWAEDVEQELFSGSSDSDNLNSTGNTDSDIKLDIKPDTDQVDSPIVDQVVPEGVVVVGAGTTLCAILEAGEEEDVTGEDEAGDFDSIDLDDSTDSDSTSQDDSDSTDPDTTVTPLDDSTDSTDSDSTILADNYSTPLDDSNPTPLDDPTVLPTPSTDVDTTTYRIINVSATGTDFSLHMVEDDTASDTNSTTAAQELFEAIQFLATVGLLNLDTYATVFDTAARACAAGPPFWLKDPLGDREIIIV